MRGHTNEDGVPDRLGGRGFYCGCDCGMPGYYVPQCPWREHAVSGELRGDDMYEMRGEVRGAWREDMLF